MSTILIIDDDQDLRELLCAIVAHLGHEPREAGSLAEGLAMAAAHAFDVVLLDMVLPDGNGLDLLPRLLGLPAPPEVMVITGRGDAPSAEKAILNGAWDYLQKPAGVEEYTTHIRRVLEYRAQKQSAVPLQSFSREGIIGGGPAMGGCLEMAAKAAASDMNVLIQGETGTGKELFARALHLNSPRKTGPFVIVDCAAIPDNLVESMLFGYERGAFTSADKARVGLIKQADTGTLFLDEVGELPLELQKSFLRVLQERTFRPIGGSETASDFRLLAATNRDLGSMVGLGAFRADLLYRISSFTLKLPPLRDRREDIPALAQYGMAVLSRRYGMPPKELSPEFLRALGAYLWPGNVRELFNTLELTLFANKDAMVLFPHHLPTHIRVEAAKAQIPVRRPDPEPTPPVLDSLPPDLPTLGEYREQVFVQAEQAYLRRLVAATNGDMKRAAAISGLSLSRLYALLRRHGIRKHYGVGQP